MNIILSDNLKKAILPGLFVLYIFGTVIAFLLNAQYFNSTLAKTFAEPAPIAQVTVDIVSLNRIAAFIGLDKSNIDALTSSSLPSTTTGMTGAQTINVLPQIPTAAPAVIASGTDQTKREATSTPSATTTLPAVQSRSATTASSTPARTRRP